MTSGETPLETSYRIDGEIFALHNGQATVSLMPGAASKTVVQVFGEPVYGDLDGDGTPDAAVLLVQTTGGSGTFFYAAAALNRKGSFDGSDAVLLGDRIAPQQLAIRHAVIIVDYADRQPDDSMATPPTVARSAYLSSRGGRLEAISLADHEILAAGEVVIGHEMRSFTPCGLEETAWLLGDSPALPAVQLAYHAAMSDQSPYTPLLMVLTGHVVAAPQEGFGADYPAGFRAVQLVHALSNTRCSSP